MEEFRWNVWNLEHATKHGCSISEIEMVVSRGGRGFPRYIGNGKYIVIGRGTGDRMVEVIYLIDPAPMIFVIHAAILTTRRRRR